jgi:peptidoglycan/LPS O-acetylase OafA/YrhL
MIAPGTTDTARSHDPGGRSVAIDACRVLAAVLVIWIHATSDVVFDGAVEHRTLGYVGVPFFTAASVLFAVRQSFRGAALGAMLSARARRILVPFLIWAGFYWVVTDLAFGLVMRGEPLRWSWSEAFKGFTWHLWFLPFVLVMGVVAAIAGRAASRSVAVSAVAALGAVFAAGGLWGVRATWDLDPRRWPYEMPVALVSFALAVAMQRGWVRVPRSVWFAGLCWAGVLGLMVYGLAWGEPPARRPAQAAGVLMLVAAVATPDRLAPAWLSRLGGLGFGVYVVHLVILQSLMKLLSRDGAWTPGEAVAAFAATVVLSFGAVWIGKRTPVVRAVLP